MEYMMTYGIAILIIAIIAGALFALGVFNSNAFSPRAQPGGCSVLRPFGPGTTASASIQGVCTTELPKFVATGFSATSASYVYTNSLTALAVSPNFTITAWVDPSGTPGSWTVVSYGTIAMGIGSCPNTVDAELGLQGDLPSLTMGCGSATATGPALTPNSWNFVAISVTSPSAGTQDVTFYVNNGTSTGVSTQSSRSTGTPSITSEQLCIGCGISNPSSPPSTGAFNGMIANVQIYNSTLSTGSVQALYFEGIGGAPIDIDTLQGWWPLNSDTKDYSGNQNSAQAFGIGYTAAWAGSYTPP